MHFQPPAQRRNAQFAAISINKQRRPLGGAPRCSTNHGIGALSRARRQGLHTIYPGDDKEGGTVALNPVTLGRPLQTVLPGSCVRRAYTTHAGSGRVVVYLRTQSFLLGLQKTYQVFGAPDTSSVTQFCGGDYGTRTAGLTGPPPPVLLEYARCWFRLVRMC